MKNSWTTLKRIISSYDHKDNLFLSLIKEDGKIVCVNATMMKELHLENPVVKETNFFDLLDPVNLSNFRSAVRNINEHNSSSTMELYLKNGQYHPMKWQVNHFSNENGEKTFLCVGHKLLDDVRLSQFNRLGEKNYQHIVEGLNAGILFQDRNGEIISINQKTAEIFNTTLERLYQLTDIKNLWNTTWSITTEDGDAVLFDETPFIKAIETGKPQTEVLVIKLANGEQKWLHFSSQPLFEENSKQAYSVITNIADLTLEKKMIGELNEKKALFAAFMKQTPTLAWVVDEESNLVFASKAFYDYFGLEERSAKHKPVTSLVPPNVANALYKSHLHVLETGTSTETVEKIEWADGRNYVFHVAIFPIDGVKGKKLVGGHAVNLADKFAVEKKLKDANERLLLLTRATSDAIWEWDMQTGYIFRNDALLDMVGYHLGDQKGLSWWLRRIHPEDRDRVSDKVKESTDSNRQSWEQEYRFKCADGTYKHMRDKGYIVYENGLPVKMIGSLQDVSNLKEMENQLMEEKLERQKEISEAIIRAQEKERTRIGHELHDNVNQILSTTKLFVDILTPSSEEEKEVKAKTVSYILLAIEEIRKLSKELVVPQLKEKGLVESIQALMDDIHLAGAIKIRFAHDFDNGLLVQSKKVTFYRIVQEQLKNILKHSQAKNVEILLQSKGNDTMLVIKDDGVGFDTRKTNRGIGLANIYERVRFYNGSAEIETSKGNGCKLTVLIPSLH